MTDVRRHGELVPPPGFDTLVTVAVGAAGPLVLWSSGTGQALAEYVDGLSPTTVVTVPDHDLDFPEIGRLPSGDFVVVGSRCQWLGPGPEQNALVVGADGSVVRRGCIGDGIEHLQVADDGTIWAGYFDEGVFGNYGWGNPGPAPLGAAGIVAWSPTTFEKVWELDTPDYRMIADCYALNVGPEAVWACPYTDFPVIRIAGGRTDVFPTGDDIGGAGDMISSGDRVGLLGAYRDPARLVIGSVASGEWVEEQRLSLTTEGSRVRCRGSVAHLFTDAVWSSVDLDDLP